jgi:hypothetical protein
LIPLGASIREKVYYKSYELGNNWFYVPSVTETEQEDAEQTDTASSGDDINIEN